MAGTGWISRSMSLVLIVVLASPPGIVPKPTPASLPSIFAPFWKESGGFTSTLIVRNIHRQFSMAVTPILFTNDGREIRLGSFELAPNSVESISLREAMEAAGVWADAGALALEVESAGPMAVTAHLIVKDVSRGLLFTFPLRGGYGRGETKTLQAAWWLRQTGDRGSLTLLNTSSESIVVYGSVVVDGNERQLANVVLGAHEFRELDFRALLQQAGVQGSMGLLSLRHDGPEHALSPALLMFNEATGFSLTANFSPTVAEGNNEQTVWRAPYVLINKPDMALGFRREMKFTPYALLSNTRNESLVVSLKAQFEMPGEAGPRNVTLPVAPLAPSETRVVDFSQFVQNGLVPEAVSWLSLELSYAGTTSDLAVRIFSVDKSGDDVFSVEALHHASVRFAAIFWDIRGEEQTLFTLRNVTDETLDVRVTLSYDNGQGRYKLPVVSIPAQGTKVVNLKQVLANAPPDEDGNVLPPDARFGAAKIDPADGKSLPRLIAVAAVFDPLTGMCGQLEIPCVGVIRTELVADPTVGVYGGVDFVSHTAEWSDGAFTDETWQSSFGSSNPSVITASSGGQLDFVGVGSVTIDGQVELEAYDERDPYYCPLILFAVLALAQSDPSVSISGLDDLPLRGSGSSGPNSITLTASGSPSGGVYNWSTTSNKVSLSGTNSPSVTVTSVSESASVGDVPIRVTYTVGTAEAQSTKNITVQKPVSLVVVSDTGSVQDLNCVQEFGGPDYDGVRRDILYQVRDSWGRAIAVTGMPVAESFTAGTNSCAGAPATPTPTTGQTVSTGNFNGVDRIAMCSSSCLPADANRRPLGNCTLSFNQTWTVNGFVSRNNTVAVTCTSVQVTPQ